MHLKHMDIYGFKSFAERVELDFNRGITAVVGPNGSGKSNIADSIRWVLGEQSIKSLRGSRMEDVIFAGSDKKKALSFAEVCLCIDNTDKLIDVDFSEINITRRMYRSGESEYYINKVQCRLKDIYELLMDTGIGKDGYSIISQGKIDEILSNKSEDRRAVFEEAVGIVKYKTRKLESERKLEQTKQNILRIQDILNEITIQIEPLKEQAEDAKKYLKLSEELKELELNIFIHNIDTFKDKSEKIKKEIIGTVEYIEYKQGELDKLDQQYKTNRSEIESIDGIIETTNEKLHQYEYKMQQLQGECDVLEQKKSGVLENIKKLTSKNCDIKVNYDKLEKEYSDLTIEYGIVEKKLCTQKKELDLIQECFEDENNDLNNIESQVENNKQELINLVNNISEIKSRINSSNLFIENIDKRIHQINQDIGSINDNILKTQDFVDSNTEDFKNFQIQIDKHSKELDNLKKMKINCENELIEYENSLNKIKSEKDEITSRLRVLEELEKDFGGYSKSVKSILNNSDIIKKLVNGYHGAVGELIRVPSNYVTAIEISLGASIQSIITENEQDAKKLIEYLKKNKLGRATFLPLSSIKPRNFSQKEIGFFNDKDFIGIASDLVECDTVYKNVVNYLLGRIAVTKDIDACIRLAKVSGYEFRVVSLDGEIINAGGSITGGSINNYTASVLSRKSEINDIKIKHIDVQKRYESILKIIDHKKQEYLDISKSITEKTDSYHIKQIELNNLKNTIDNLQKDITINKERLNICNKENEELINQNESTRSSIRLDSMKKQEMEMKKEKIEKQITDLQAKYRELSEKKDTKNTKITQYKVEISALSQKIISIEELISDIRNRIKDIQKEITDNQLDIDNSTKEIKYIDIEQNSKHSELNKIQISINELRQSKDHGVQRRTQLNEKINKIEILKSQYDNEIKTANLNLNKVQLQETKIEMEIESVELKLLETYELNYNKALTFKDEELSISWAINRCIELRTSIREMGMVNVNAIEEYSNLTERHKFLLNQLDDLINAKESLAKIIKEISDNMKLQFISEFTKINESFREVFVELFGGGNAELVLSESDNVLETGIEIIAKPPGKKQQALSLLSGGERALTAIALLFGILRLKPAPFCVLDEIDAALDDANVDRYAKYLSQFSKTTQFIIITHRKGTMEVADSLYGVSMQNSGISKLVSVKFEQKVS